MIFDVKSLLYVTTAIRATNIVTTDLMTTAVKTTNIVTSVLLSTVLMIAVLASFYPDNVSKRIIC